MQTASPATIDARSFLQQLVAHDPQQLLVVDREVDPVFEATSLVDRLRSDHRYPKFPAVLFTNVRGSKIPHLLNLHATYERLALAIDSDLTTMVEEFGRRESEPIAPVEVRKADSPVKRVVWVDREADLGRLPLLQHMELDAGKYITSGVSITRDPDSGVLNAGIFRAQLHSRSELGFMTAPYQSTHYILRKRRERGEPLEVAMVIGHHPALLLAGATKPPGLGGELEIAGGLMRRPLELVRAEAVDLLVPARAEIVIEGVVETDPATYREEGPFAEYPRYYTATGQQPVLRVRAITMRENAIYIGVFNASDEHLALGGLARTGFLLRRARDVVPTVVNVHMPLSASARTHAYISIKKRSDGEPHLAAFNLLAYSPATKHVFLVDDDIDVTQEDQVMWALATRFQADKDLTIIRNTIGSRLNPPTYGYRRDETGGLETKLIFDCTRPVPPATFPSAARVPADVRARMDPAHYVRALRDEDYSALGFEG
jgi:2,5-furandicarboxylate decarboxylase 1